MPDIRRATPQDAAEIARLNAHVQGWHAAQYPDVFFADPDAAALADYFQGRLQEPGVTCFLAYHPAAGDPAIGYALCALSGRPLSVFSPPIRRIVVDQIAVAPDARRLGVGAALLAAAKALARDEHCDELLLDTWEGNHDAHAFFEANGFALRRMLYRALP